MDLAHDDEERADIDEALEAPVAVSDKSARQAWVAAAAADLS